MEISYVLTEADVAAFVRYHGSQTASGRWRLWIRLLCVCGFGCMFFLLLIFHKPSPATSQPEPTKQQDSHIGTILGGIVFLILVGVIVARVFWPRVRLSKADRASLLGRQRLTLASDGVRVETDFGSNRMSWRGILRIRATRTHAFIFSSSATAFVVPRRAFADDERFEEFIETARRFWREAGASPAEEASPDWKGEVARAWRPKHETEGVRPPDSEPPDDLKHRE
jgi:hypothetical protein